MIDLLRIGFDERISAAEIAEGLRRHAGDVASEDVDELAAVLEGYLRAVPDALEAALAMSKDPHFGRAVAFATGTILTYIFDEEDLLPEASFGVVGLLDDAYLVHGFVDSLRRMYPLAAASSEYAAPDARKSEIVAAVLPEGVAESLRRTCESTIQVAQALFPSGQRVDGADVTDRAAAQSGGGGGRHRLGAGSVGLRIPASLDAHLDAVLEIGVPGTVAVAARPGFSWERAVGVADLSSGAPMTLEHRFRIASVTKLFVATAVLQLVDEGALRARRRGRLDRGRRHGAAAAQPHERPAARRRDQRALGAVSREPRPPSGVDASRHARADRVQAPALRAGRGVVLLGQQLRRPWAARRGDDGCEL